MLQRHSLPLVTKHFSRSHKLHKNFNQNTVKVSYSSINNKSKIIKGHNEKVALKLRDQTPKYNCRKKAECPMEGNCKVNVVLYKYDVTNKAKAIHYLRRCILNVQRENGRSVSITTRYHLNTSDISIRQHFQGTCDT